MLLPLSSTIARTFPNVVPATTRSPRSSVPVCTRTVATGPRPLSRCASMTRPMAGRSGSALSSATSATRSTTSTRSSMPSFVFAETATSGVSPPNSSTVTPFSASCDFTWFRFASGRSILLSATTIGTPAAFACEIASIVCCCTPSSAATTSTATSVTCAPRARIAVKASWPGVSRNVTLRPLCSIW